jgi:hypothetical protein
MSDERELQEPLGPEHPLLHHQAGVIDSILKAMCQEDKDMVLAYLGLSEVEVAPGRKMGSAAGSETLSKKKQ